MSFEIYCFPNGKNISMEDLLRLATQLPITVSAIERTEWQQRKILGIGHHQIAPESYRHRGFDYILDVFDDNNAILHIIERSGGDVYRHHLARQGVKTENIQMPSKLEHFTLIGPNDMGQTVLWAIVSYVAKR